MASVCVHAYKHVTQMYAWVDSKCPTAVGPKWCLVSGTLWQSHGGHMSTYTTQHNTTEPSLSGVQSPHSRTWLWGVNEAHQGTTRPSSSGRDLSGFTQTQRYFWDITVLFIVNMSLLLHEVIWRTLLSKVTDCTVQIYIFISIGIQL